MERCGTRFACHVLVGWSGGYCFVLAAEFAHKAIEGKKTSHILAITIVGYQYSHCDFWLTAKRSL